MDMDHHSGPGNPSTSRCSGPHITPSEDHPRGECPECLLHPFPTSCSFNDRGNIQNGKDADGGVRHRRDDLARELFDEEGVIKQSGVEALTMDEGRRDDRDVCKGRWAWLRALVQIFRQVGRERRTRAGREQNQGPLALPPARPRMPPLASVVPSSSGAGQQPSASSSRPTQTNSEVNSPVPSHTPLPIHVVPQGATRVEGHTSFAILEGMNQAHDECLSVLKLSTRWFFNDLRNIAIAQLEHLELTDTERVVLGKEYHISRWVLAGYDGLKRLYDGNPKYLQDAFKKELEDLAKEEAPQLLSAVAEDDPDESVLGQLGTNLRSGAKRYPAGAMDSYISTLLGDKGETAPELKAALRSACPTFDRERQFYAQDSCL
ncbi:hypothetical protein BKA70DRAFT_1445122 [Coprinopsis sp. MPI-PUGE-AT-0042]|nr:hypothetical protein BKA70DRAFT_1445122 [Coprinopsis sp. MPI-PUGE-AT-0042]